MVKITVCVTGLLLLVICFFFFIILSFFPNASALVMGNSILFNDSTSLRVTHKKVFRVSRSVPRVNTHYGFVIPLGD